MFPLFLVVNSCQVQKEIKTPHVPLLTHFDLKLKELVLYKTDKELRKRRNCQRGQTQIEVETQHSKQKFMV